MATFGTLLLFWNLVQSLIPVFTGGLSDRYGYKQTIFASTVIKSLGYLVMAWFHSYWGFFAGAMLLATGTAIFKPGVQGTLIKATNRRNSSMAWGIFYQTVNIGGWIGPLIALQMRLLAWKYVFYINAAVICCNFLLLLTYREPGKEERLARQQRLREGNEKQRSLALEALAELKKPHLALYLIIFSVWWLMFPMLWDVLPKYIEDWVDTAPMVQFLFGADGTQSGVLEVPPRHGRQRPDHPAGRHRQHQRRHDHAHLLPVRRAEREDARHHQHVGGHRARGRRADPLRRDQLRSASPCWP